jgi:hypothetical protein
MLRVAYAAAHSGAGSSSDSGSNDGPLTTAHRLADDGPRGCAHATTQNGGRLIRMCWGGDCAQCEQATA